MNAQRQRGNWLLDAVLLAGFLLAMLLDLTGVGLHQWLGIAIPALAGYHIVRHWAWIKAVTGRLLGKTSAGARRFWAVDAALLLGFLSIMLTGLVISTWLDLGLANYAAWHTVHVVASVATLGLLVVKVGLHWRWIVTTFRRYVEPVHPAPLPGGALQPAVVRVRRRDFIAMMGALAAVSLLTGTKALSSVVEAGPATVGDDAATATAATVAQSGSSCQLACGRRCSYPGQCRRYTDSNGNGKCDLGECGSGTAAGSGGSADFSGGGRFSGGAVRGRMHGPRG